MKLPQAISRVGKRLVSAAYSNLPFPGVARPCFIIGCGRSGTTILGESLSQHRHITYLNEPRHLWFSAYPETDVWSPQARHREGKLFLSKADTVPRKSKKLSRLFRLETVISGRPLLVEKLPINAFRLDFIHGIFPDARFIHLYRNGLEVARSIEGLCKAGQWFGADSYKWKKLVDYAHVKDGMNELPKECTDCFDKGLLEWRLSTEAAIGFLRYLPKDKYFEISYEEFIDSPVDTISEVLGFIGVDRDPVVEAFVSKRVARRSSKLSQHPIPQKAQLIGGKLLQLSLERGAGLVSRCISLADEPEATILGTTANNSG